MLSKFILYSFSLITILLVGCSANELIELEDSNAYPWQKYMSEEEFNQLEEGMTYEEVVDIVKGAGKSLDDHIYRWLDEKLVTQVYDIEFKEDRLVAKKIVEIKGKSTRGLPEKEPATPGEPAENTETESDSTGK